jgi:hypothetical protein
MNRQCGHQTIDGNPCTHEVTEGNDASCAAGHPARSRVLATAPAAAPESHPGAAYLLEELAGPQCEAESPSSRRCAGEVVSLSEEVAALYGDICVLWQELPRRTRRLLADTGGLSVSRRYGVGAPRPYYAGMHERRLADVLTIERQPTALMRRSAAIIARLDAHGATPETRLLAFASHADELIEAESEQRTVDAKVTSRVRVARHHETLRATACHAALLAAEENPAPESLALLARTRQRLRVTLAQMQDEYSTLLARSGRGMPAAA